MICLRCSLESHPEEYHRMLSSETPILKNGNSTIEEYFSLIPEIGKGWLNQQIRKMMELEEV